MPKTKTKRIKKKKGKTKNKKTINKIRLLKKKIKEEIELANKKKLPEIRGLSGMNLPPGITSFYDSNLASRIKSNDALAVERNTQTILDEQAKMIKEQAKNDPRIKQAEEMEKVLIKLRNKPAEKNDEEKKFKEFVQLYKDNMNIVKDSFQSIWDELENRKKEPIKIEVDEDSPVKPPKPFETPKPVELPRLPTIPQIPEIELIDEGNPEFDKELAEMEEQVKKPEEAKVKKTKSKKKKKVEADIEEEEEMPKLEEVKKNKIQFHNVEYDNLGSNKSYYKAFFSKYPNDKYFNGEEFVRGFKYIAAKEIFNINKPRQYDDTTLSKKIVEVIKQKLNIK